MPSIGLPELIVILMILLLVFGASRLPQIGESLGRSMRSIKRGIVSDDQIEVSPARPEKDAGVSSAGKVQPEVADAELVDKKP